MNIRYEPEFELVFVDDQPVSAQFLKMLVGLPEGATLSATRRNGIFMDMRMTPAFHPAGAPHDGGRIQ